MIIFNFFNDFKFQSVQTDVLLSIDFVAGFFCRMYIIIQELSRYDIPNMKIPSYINRTNLSIIGWFRLMVFNGTFHNNQSIINYSLYRPQNVCLPTTFFRR